ncbi:hypothetical protein L486_01112 [Kwoniella mangroviensis CBS 10435]|uniref:Major facilitator superfamily (MFS) profile domain-containing protein n=1 Tax=Kwoniella mangroviensis CBS 10435 TaxID=1331196 RepID=A0A1B9J1F0_9TREE|nr:uncharacterized protein I203_05960 [Kwoniella mangroviensis CBS 8507]OCF61464.1 hypothetical protein L486_01112 [Kwoniella mangroviensis CBS 10435]OCF64716.1 hypothetical protein I203_05960 [Kwoniella mangroviensis CBS 8507]
MSDPYYPDQPLEATPKRTLWGKIRRIIWDDIQDPEERAFVRRLDCGLMTIAMLGYFVKYLSQANIANAYASGMKEDLNFKGNEYNTLLTMFTVGYVIGQFPGTLATVKVSPSIWLPTCEVIWTALVMSCAAAKNVHTLYGLRFIIGLLEASAYPGMLWVLGSWYGPAELGKRVVMFQATSSVGTMFSGYLQAAVHSGLDGVGGYKGWQYLMFMDGVICMPIAIAGYFLIPDIPTRPNPRARWYLRDQDLKMAIARMERYKRAPTKGFTLDIFKKTMTSWIPWTFFIPYTCFVVGLGSYAYMNLWLKATPPWKGDVTAINVIPTGGYALSIVMSLVYAWSSDALGTRWPICFIGGFPPLVGNIILSVWPAKNSTKFAGFFLNFTATPIGAIMLAWVNEIMASSGEARAITIGFLNTSAYTINAWAPNLIFPASQAPHYKAGYKVTTAFFAIWIVSIPIILVLLRTWSIPKYQQDEVVEEEEGAPKSINEKNSTENERLPDLESSLAKSAVISGVDGKATEPQ